MTAVSPRTFSCNENFSRVSIQGHDFFLSGGLCTIVRLLHVASETDDLCNDNRDVRSTTISMAGFQAS